MAESDKVLRRVIEPYDHDCKDCQWVGWFSPWADKEPMNVYVCKSKEGDSMTIVIRFSSEPSDYWSVTTGCLTKGSLIITQNDAD